MSSAIAATRISQPLAGSKPCARRSLRATKVMAAAGEPQKQSKANGLHMAPKLLGLLSAGAVLLGGSGMPAEAALGAPPALERRAENAKDNVVGKAEDAVSAVKQGASNIVGNVENAGDAAKAAVGKVGDGADGVAWALDQVGSSLTSSPDPTTSEVVRTPNAGIGSVAQPSVPASGNAGALGDVALGGGGNAPMPPVAPNAGAKATQANKEVAGNVVDAVKEGASKLVGGAQDAGDSVKSNARQAVNSAPDAPGALKSAKNAIVGKAEDAVDAVKQGASNLVGGAQDAGDNIKSTASDVSGGSSGLKWAAEQVGNTLTSSPNPAQAEAARTPGSGASQNGLRNELDGLASRSGQVLQAQGSAAANAAGKGSNAVQGAVKDAARPLADAAKSASDATAKNVRNIKDTVKSVGQQAGDAVEQAGSSKPARRSFF